MNMPLTFAGSQFERSAHADVHSSGPAAIASIPKSRIAKIGIVF
jgi:hypothetical protein